MTESPYKTVQVGEDAVRIQRFRGLKAILAGALVARVMREVPQIQDRVNEYIKRFREENTLTITRGMARLPRFAAYGLTTEDFQAAGGDISIPDEPTPQQILMNVGPDLFDLARKEVMRFIALIAIPNQDLEDADDSDGVDEALDRVAKRLLRQGTIGELLELIEAGWEVMEEEILSKKDKLGKLRSLPFLKAWLSTEETEETEEEDISTPPTSPEDVQTSSTDSEPSTDGIGGKLSTASPGAS